MTPTVVEIAPRGDDATCTLTGDLVIPRLVRRRGRRVEIALVAGRALLLPGDEVRMRISVGEGCALSLVDIGGLVVYGRPDEAGIPSQWHAQIELAAGAHLVWDGLPTVITDDATLSRSLTVSLAAGSSATLRETLVLGRTGERGGRVTMETDIADSDGPLLRETLAVGGGMPVPGVLGRHRVVDGITAVGTRSPIDITPLDGIPGAERFELERGGVVLRYLGHAAHDSPLAAVRLDTWGPADAPAAEPELAPEGSIA